MEISKGIFSPLMFHSQHFIHLDVHAVAPEPPEGSLALGRLD